MSRFDRRLKGAGTNSVKSNSGSACVPQPLPTRAPLLSGMGYFNSNSAKSLVSNNSKPTLSGNLKFPKGNTIKNESLESLVNKVDVATNKKYDNNIINMINRRLKRLEQSANTNKVYESLNTRLKNLELMYSENMENMERYVKNQEDRINLLTEDYRKTLKTLNGIIKSVNEKILELDARLPVNDDDKKLEEVTIEEPKKEEIESIKAKANIKSEETDDTVISEVTEEILSNVIKNNSEQDKNISLTVTEKEEVSS